jgi:hypothetical protein
MYYICWLCPSLWDFGIFRLRRLLTFLVPRTLPSFAMERMATSYFSPATLRGAGLDSRAVHRTEQLGWAA